MESLDEASNGPVPSQRWIETKFEYYFGEVIENLQQSLRKANEGVYQCEAETSGLRRALEKIAKEHSILDNRLQAAESHFHDEQEKIKVDVQRNTATIAALHNISFPAQTDDLELKLKLKIQDSLAAFEKRVIQRIISNEANTRKLDQKIEGIQVSNENRLAEMDHSMSARMEDLTLRQNESSFEILAAEMKILYEEFDNFASSMTTFGSGNSLGQEIQASEFSRYVDVDETAEDEMDQHSGNTLTLPSTVIDLFTSIQLALESVQSSISGVVPIKWATPVDRTRAHWHRYLYLTFTPISQIQVILSWSQRSLSMLQSYRKWFFIMCSVSLCIILYYYCVQNSLYQDLNGKALPRWIRRQLQNYEK